MKVKRIEVGQMKSNCYVLVDEKSSTCLIIDPGDDADYIQRIIGDFSVTPIAILATHGHFDHVMAVFELKLAYNIPFMMAKEDEFLLARMNSSALHFVGSNSALPVPEVDVGLKPGILEIGNWKFEIIYTPGHTPGSVIIYFREQKMAFVGDLVFEGGYVGRVDFSYSDPEALENSLLKVLKLPSDTEILSGHGETTFVRDLKEFVTN